MYLLLLFRYCPLTNPMMFTAFAGLSRHLASRWPLRLASRTFHRQSLLNNSSLSFVGGNSTSTNTQHNITEIQIPTPWGHLAAKCWNLPTTDPKELVSSCQTPPVLCLHGWQDNAGSWDTLIPLLDRNIPFICLDLCGHGKSSVRPMGTSSDNVMHVWDVRRVVDFFSLEDGLNLMGHSMGGAIALCYAGTFPEMMNKCLVIDVPGQFPRFLQWLLSVLDRGALWFLASLRPYLLSTSGILRTLPSS